MTVPRLLRHAATAALIALGTFQGQSDPSNVVGLLRNNLSCLWVVEANGSNSNETSGVGNDSEDSRRRGEGGGPGRSKKNSSGGIVPEIPENRGDTGPSGSKGGSENRASGLRGVSSNSQGSTPSSQPEKPSLQSIFGNLFQNFGSDEEGGHPLAEQASDAKAFNDLIDRIFVPRLQTAPKYQGALESINESIYRDVLRGPKKVKGNVQLLQQAYSVINHPAKMLDVPDLFVELRAAADRRIWDQTRQREKAQYERKGDPVPKRFEMSADDVVALEAEEPRVREEELSNTELQARIRMINGWMKEQFRLRLYYSKRTGALKADPQDLVDTFNPGPNVPVTVEDIIGLSYEAELEPEPELEDSGKRQVPHGAEL
ncbi:hypothetical protein, conserved [Eimeria tenella]|uniref:Uncharacterized protein n=1 Tax=Eimeria tenella TaxID=5802 RepID=H9B988_EIMTE|nr:hypothetical protein, conserved [Eimeria tenella]AET50548.1 hypothetical protein [Eimeria tenella]CDJ37574.1 hypothetical protein, conserved [Eimeria tenella]|eukprot:XP_013228412.1 hypothetical protein, conserved [Eimeria tenella]